MADDRELMAQRESLGRQRLNQLDELRLFSRQGVLDVDRSASRRYFASQLIETIHLVEHNQEILTGQLELCRQALVEADREVKGLEKLQEKQLAKHRYEQEHRTNRELEESWLSTRVGKSSK